MQKAQHPIPDLAVFQIAFHNKNPQLVIDVRLPVRDVCALTLHRNSDTNEISLYGNASAHLRSIGIFD